MATATYTAREARRLAGFQLFQRGLGPTEIARRLGAPVSTVERWARRFREEGAEGVRDRPRSGRPHRLDEARRKELVEILLAGAVAAGFESEYWSMPRVRQVVQQRFGAVFHVDYLGVLLRKLGFTPQKPARVSRRKEPRAAEEFRRKTWPQARKKGA